MSNNDIEILRGHIDGLAIVVGVFLHNELNETQRKKFIKGLKTAANTLEESESESKSDNNIIKGMRAELEHFSEILTTIDSE